MYSMQNFNTLANQVDKTLTLENLEPGSWIQTHQQPTGTSLLLSGLGVF